MLLDVAMPGMDGWKVARLLQHDPGSARSGKSFAFLAHAVEADHQQSIEARCDEHGFTHWRSGYGNRRRSAVL